MKTSFIIGIPWMFLAWVCILEMPEGRELWVIKMARTVKQSWVQGRIFG
jgi:hypothetical protein